MVLFVVILFVFLVLVGVVLSQSPLLVGVLLVVLLLFLLRGGSVISVFLRVPVVVSFRREQIPVRKHAGLPLFRDYCCRHVLELVCNYINLWNGFPAFVVVVGVGVEGSGIVVFVVVVFMVVVFMVIGGVQF